MTGAISLRYQTTAERVWHELRLVALPTWQVNVPKDIDDADEKQDGQNFYGSEIRGLCHVGGLT